MGLGDVVCEGSLIVHLAKFVICQINCSYVHFSYCFFFQTERLQRKIRNGNCLRTEYIFLIRCQVSLKLIFGSACSLIVKKTQL